jgi:hypothetical protein
MCCCGCAMSVLEPGAGFGSWRALFGWGGKRQVQPSTEAKDVITQHVITVAAGLSQLAYLDESAQQEKPSCKSDRTDQVELNGDRT